MRTYPLVLKFPVVLTINFLILFSLNTTSSQAQVKNLSKVNKQSQTHQKNLTKVSATYDVSFTGIPLGKYKFSSIASDTNYSLSGQTKLDFLGFFLSWKADIRSSGQIKNNRITPGTFSYKFKGRKTRKKTVVFPSKNAGKMKINPPLKPSEKRVAFKPGDLKNAFDPMSGLIQLTKLNGRQPSREICTRTIPIFDGKQRYDISLEYQRKQVVKLGKKGYRSAFVCAVNYKPIAGHKKKNRMQNFYKKENRAEVFLVPFPEANMYVPVRLDVPTPYGPSAINVSKFVIENPKQKRLALIY